MFIMIRIKSGQSEKITQKKKNIKICLSYTGGKGCERGAPTYGFHHVQHVVFNEIMNKNCV